MQKIVDYLKSKPYISISAVEKLCSIPTGTIRLTGNRTIPEKYKEPLMTLLGLNDDVQTIVQVIEAPKEVVQTSDITTVVCEARDNTTNFYKDKQGLFQRHILPKGSRYTISKVQ